MPSCFRPTRAQQAPCKMVAFAAQNEKPCSSAKSSSVSIRATEHINPPAKVRWSPRRAEPFDYHTLQATLALDLTGPANLMEVRKMKLNSSYTNCAHN